MIDVLIVALLGVLVASNFALWHRLRRLEEGLKSVQFWVGKLEERIGGLEEELRGLRSDFQSHLAYSKSGEG